ncbi:protein mono-ADP-ribosyltransferase PARP10 isoform X2 [Pristis pectinata]|uniref:protein mono-ADP-ribosyltransferase PARP10 isoform X2 n=1 Tax=Pristis pectinata TaxID=685728 RepID=UPI00223D5D51|nr:protein mono-ADP-ribosyltransferase PARP10 isoform X2 [Pristis pectinata]
MEEQCPGDDRVLEVHGIGNISTDVLALYFENKRRSGGGTISSIRREGDHAVITFENPADAQQVASKPEHTFQDIRLIVKKVPPNNPRVIVLSDLRPKISDDVLMLFLENITGLDGEKFTMHFNPDRSQVVVHFQEALSAGAIEEMKRKTSSKCLQGATIQVEQLPHTDRILVENLGPTDDEEIMRLYFESRRSNGGNVLNVTMLPGGKAIVEFQDWKVADRVLQKRQTLQQRELIVRPYYSFLHLPSTGQECDERREEVTAEAPATQHSSMINVPGMLKMKVLRSSRLLQDLTNEYLDLSVEADNGNIIHVSGRDLQQIEKVKSRILEFLNNVAQVDVPISHDLSKFLSRTDIQDYFQTLLGTKEPLFCYSVTDCTMTVTGPSLPAAREAACLIEQQVSQFSVSVTDQQLHVLTSPEWEKLLSSLRCCSTRLTDAGDQVWFISLACFRAENEKRVENLLNEAVLQESVIVMEPGKLRYLQDYNQDLLTGNGQVSLYPLEGDITGLRVTGQASSCQTMDELLRSIISTIRSRTVTLQEPGISRFLLDKTGADILKQLEGKYKCTIGLERACWIPQSEHPLETQRNQGTPRFERTASVPTELPVLLQQSADAADPNKNIPDLDEIRSLLASIKETDQKRGEDATTLTSQRAPGGSADASDDEDIYTDQLPIVCPGSDSDIEEAPIDNGNRRLQDGDNNNNGACGLVSEAIDADDDPQLYLALQYSMDSRLQQSKEEEEFQRALELSKMATGVDESDLELATRMSKIEISEAGLEEAIKMSMAEALRASNSAHVTIYGSTDMNFNQLVDELERKIQSFMCEKSVQHPCLQNLPNDFKSYLEYLQRKHAVAIVGQGSQVTVRGFVDYVVAAKEDITQLVQWVIQDEVARAEEATLAKSVQWVRHNQQGVAVSYTLKANAFIEKAFQQKQKKIDVIFDNKPYTIDFEQMTEYNVGAAESLSVVRKSLTSPVDVDMLPMASGCVELVQVNETTEEYTKMTAHFFKTLKDRHDKIKIIKVEKVNNPLLYQQYMLKKASMVATQSDVERVLYHGTSEESAKEIYTHGFNRSFCGKNAAVYGQGVYFAASSIVSVDNQYSPPNPDGHKFVFVVNVLTGSYTKGDGKMKTPPLKDSKMSLRYDSLVDNCDNPKIFVVFHDTQAYPQYLITCQWK